MTRTHAPRPINVYAESSEDDTWSRFGGALLNTFIMIGGIVIVTFIFVCLFYFRLMWVRFRSLFFFFSKKKTKKQKKQNHIHAFID